MEIKPLKLGARQARLPLIQGGMGVGISLGRLAGAVAGEGGVGIISTAQIGFRESDFDRDSLGANLRAVKKEFDRARAIAPEGVVGFNIMVASRCYEAYVRAAVAAGADIIISGAGLPMDLPKAAAEVVRETGRETEPALAPIVSTEKAARVVLRYWDKKYKRVPDLLVVEGPLAGGHLGFTRKQLDKFAQLGQGASKETSGQKDREDGADISPAYQEEIRAILETVRSFEERYGRKIPVALAGGIDDRERARRAFDLGADAIQVASRFVTTEECDADIRYKEAYIRAGKEDIVIVKSPVGMPGRAIRNRFMERVMSGEKIPHSPCHRCLHTCNPAEIPYCITDALVSAAKGDVENALLFCGAGAWKADRIETVREVIQSLLQEHRKENVHGRCIQGHQRYPRQSVPRDMEAGGAGHHHRGIQESDKQ